MLNEDGERKSLEQLLAMTKLAPVWNLLNDEEKTAVQYTAGVLRSDMAFIIRGAKPGGFVKKFRPYVKTLDGPVTI